MKPIVYELRWVLIGLLLIGCNKKEMHQALPMIGVDSGPKIQAPRNVMIVAWGQSNMAGTGEEPITDWHDNLKFYDGYIRSGMEVDNKVGPWNIIKVPAYKWTGYQRGPSYRFALDWLKQYPNDTVYVVNCAESGTSIAAWDGTLLFQRCVDYVNDAKDPAIPNLIMGPQLVMQGEEDGVENTQDWATRFQSIASAMRAATGAMGSPIIYGQIGANAWNTLNWDSVKAQQASVSMPNTYMIKTDDLPYGGGEHLNGHFTPAGYQGIADRMFQTWKELNP